MNLYIVESPLQLLCAFEVITIDNQPYELLIRKTGRGLNDVHLLNCVKILDLNYTLFELRPEYLFIDFSKNFVLFIRLYMANYNKVYFGSIYSSALKLIRKFLTYETALYLDDGAATIRAQLEISKNKLDKVNWFTFMNLQPLDNQLILKHSFMNLKEKFKKKISSGVFFIGQPVEIMMGFEIEDYGRCVSKIAASLENGETLKYIPHRVEKIEHIINIPNIEILYLDVPIELYFLTCVGNLPQKFYSCYSTALITLSCLFNEVEIYSIKNAKSKEVLDNLDVIYEYFEMNNIKVISI